MSDAITVRIKNLDQFQHGLRDFPVTVARQILAYALRRAGQYLNERTQAGAPVRSGKLRSSILYRGKKQSPFEQSAFVEAHLWYAPLVEYGHKWQVKRHGRVIKSGTKGPQAYFRPAFDSSKGALIDMIGDDIGNAAARRWKKLGGS